MGCGCNKKLRNGTVVGNVTRTTVYQVLGQDGQVISEHPNPREARKAAIETGGRWRATSKIVADAVR